MFPAVMHMNILIAMCHAARIFSMIVMMTIEMDMMSMMMFDMMIMLNRVFCELTMLNKVMMFYIQILWLILCMVIVQTTLPLRLMNPCITNPLRFHLQLMVIMVFMFLLSYFSKVALSSVAITIERDQTYASKEELKRMLIIYAIKNNYEFWVKNI